MRVTPEGKMIPTCPGLRSPGGIGFNAAGDVFYTDNQGYWNGTCPLRQLIPGEFEGNPAGLEMVRRSRGPAIAGERRRSGEAAGAAQRKSRLVDEAKRIPAAASAGGVFSLSRRWASRRSGIVCDLTGGKFGPVRRTAFRRRPDAQHGDARLPGESEWPLSGRVFPVPAWVSIRATWRRNWPATGRCSCTARTAAGASRGSASRSRCNGWCGRGRRLSRSRKCTRSRTASS